MDAENIFGLFDSEQEGSNVKRISSTTEFPYIFINLFIKLVLQVEILNLQAEKTLKGLGSSIDIPKLKHANKLMSTARAYELIAQFNPSDNTHVEALLDSDLEAFDLACDKILATLTQYEEYEKCSFIKELKDFINFSPNKLPS